jgi:hypothetical protein
MVPCTSPNPPLRAQRAPARAGSFPDPNPTLPGFNCRIAKGLFVPDVGGLSDDRDSGIDAVEQPCVPLLAVENPTFKLSITQNGVTFNSYGQRISMNVAIRRAVRICSTGARFP